MAEWPRATPSPLWWLMASLMTAHAFVLLSSAAAGGAGFAGYGAPGAPARVYTLRSETLLAEADVAPHYVGHRVAGRLHISTAWQGSDGAQIVRFQVGFRI